MKACSCENNSIILIEYIKGQLIAYSKIVCITFLFMFVAHSFAWYNLHFVHDSVDIMGYNYYPNAVSLGRWGTFIATPFAGTPILPWYFAILSILAWSLVFFVVFYAFSIPFYYQILFIGVFSTGIKFIVQNAAHIEMLGWESVFIIFIIIPLLLIKRGKRIWLHVAISISSCIALATIQQNIELVIGFLLIHMFVEVTSKDVSWKDYFKQGISYIVDVIVGGMLYIGGLLAAIKFTDTTIVTDHASGIGSLQNVTFKEYIIRILCIYKHSLSVFLRRDSYLNGAVRIINALFIFFTFISIVLWIISCNKNIKKILQGGIILFLIPIGFDCVYVFAAHHMYSLNEYPVLFLYLVPVVLVNSYKDAKIIKNSAVLNRAKLIIIGCACILIVHNIRFANVMYLKEKLVYDHSTACLQTIWEDMMRTEGYEAGITPIAFIGNTYDSLLKYNGFLGENYEDVMPYDVVVSYQWNWKSYYEVIKGTPINLVVDTAYLEENNAVRNMPCYPLKGYCEMIDDTLVVKVSNTYE